MDFENLILHLFVLVIKFQISVELFVRCSTGVYPFVDKFIFIASIVASELIYTRYLQTKYVDI